MDFSTFIVFPPLHTCTRATLYTGGAVGESDAVSRVTLGLLVFPPVDGGDDLVAPSPPMMAHLLSLGTQSEDAAETPPSRAPLVPPLPSGNFYPLFTVSTALPSRCVLSLRVLSWLSPMNVHVFFSMS